MCLFRFILLVSACVCICMFIPELAISTHLKNERSAICIVTHRRSISSQQYIPHILLISAFRNTVHSKDTKSKIFSKNFAVILTNFNPLLFSFTLFSLPSAPFLSTSFLYKTFPVYIFHRIGSVSEMKQGFRIRKMGSNSFFFLSA